jgi:hypothetical protein
VIEHVNAAPLEEQQREQTRLDAVQCGKDVESREREIAGP